MVGPKEKFGPEGYKVWYARHRIVEKQRQWKIKNEANPILALSLAERGPMPDTSPPEGLEN